MKAITNTDIIESRSSWAKRIAPLTMLFLIGGLVTNFMSMRNPAYFRPTLVLLALGLIFAMASSYLVNRWVREPRTDQVLKALLKKFGSDYILFNYTMRNPAHVLLTPTRLYVVVVKRHDGQITVKGSRFSRKFTLRRLFRFFAEEGLGLPVTEAKSGISKLYDQLNEELPEEEIPEIEGLILFSNREVELNIQEPPPMPMVRSNEVKNYLRQNNKARNISAEQRSTLTEIIGGQWAE